jgi:hypothetical protein
MKDFAQFCSLFEPPESGRQPLPNKYICSYVLTKQLTDYLGRWVAQRLRCDGLSSLTHSPKLWQAEMFTTRNVPVRYKTVPQHLSDQSASTVIFLHPVTNINELHD